MDQRPGQKLQSLKFGMGNIKWKIFKKKKKDSVFDSSDFENMWLRVLNSDLYNMQVISPETAKYSPCDLRHCLNVHSTFQNNLQIFFSKWVTLRESVYLCIHNKVLSDCLLTAKPVLQIYTMADTFRTDLIYHYKQTSDWFKTIYEDFLK